VDEQVATLEDKQNSWKILVATSAGSLTDEHAERPERCATSL